MPFAKIDSAKVSQAVIRQIELLVLRGILQSGERLTAERDLAERQGISRASLHDALSDLAESGPSYRKAGAGIFVAELLGPAFSKPLIRLFSIHDEAIFDYIAFRRDMERLAAEPAARFGAETDRRVIAEISHKMETAHANRSSGDEAWLDADFHMAIVKAHHIPRHGHAPA